MQTSIPHMPETNGKAETTVKPLKKLVAGCEGDPKKLAAGMLALRNTGVECGIPPAMRAFGRLMREQKLPCLEPQGSVREREAQSQTASGRRAAGKQRQEQSARELPSLREGQEVRIQHPVTMRWTGAGAVAKRAGNEYVVQQERGGTLRRSRVQLRPSTTKAGEGGPGEQEADQGPRRSTRTPKPRERLDL